MTFRIQYSWEKMSEILVWRLTDVITQRNINVYKSKLIVGRSKGADITCMSAAASRSHAEFTLGDNGKLLMVTDLNVSFSFNYVFLKFIINIRTVSASKWKCKLNI